MCIPTACVLYSELVCVQLPKSPVNAGNEALLAFAAERRTAAPCCGAAAAGRQVAIAVDRYFLPTRRSAANPPHARLRSNDGTCRRTDAPSFHRPCCAYYASSVNERGNGYFLGHFPWHFALCKVSITDIDVVCFGKNLPARRGSLRAAEGVKSKGKLSNKLCSMKKGTGEMLDTHKWHSLCRVGQKTAHQTHGRNSIKS